MSYATLASFPDAEAFESSPPGVSDESVRVAEMFGQTRYRLFNSVSTRRRIESLAERMQELVQSHSDPGWDGYEARPVSAHAMRKALRFALSLPPVLANAEITADPSGDIEFEWYQAPRHLFAVSIAENGKMHFAGLFGSAKQMGTDFFTDAIPNEVLRGIRRAIE
jgi:hypothetical protein